MKLLWGLLFAVIWGQIAAAAQDTTSTGIPLTTAWHKKVYEYAKQNVVHPSWGINHSERNYHVAKDLATKDGIKLDEDVLFVSAFLHDLGGLAGFEKEGVDHGVRSVEIIEPLLQQWGFPMSKFPQVKEMIIGHVYTSPAPASSQAQAFRDADIVDFLGSIGVARILAVTQEAGRASPTLKPLVDLLKNFAATLPPKCSLQACKDLAVTRKAEMERFFGELDASTFRGTAL